jgi:Fic family protein
MDESLRKLRITEVPVRAHGPFAFSRFYEDGSILQQAETASVWNTTFSTLPILPAWAARLNEDLIVRSIFGTAAIEGSPLTEPEVSALLTGRSNPQPQQEKEKVILNLSEAYRLAGVGGPRSGKADVVRLSENRIRTLHETIARGLDHDRYLPGTYRYGPVEVGDADHGGKYKPPKVPEDIPMLMARFVEWANSEPLIGETPAVVRAFLVHYHLALIHPFKDGNGRLARVVEAELLEAAGFRYVSLMMSNFYYEHIDDYYRAFTRAERNDFDLTPFLTFCLGGLVRSLMDIHQRVSDDVRRLALRKHYDDLETSRSITARQHALLLILLEDDRPFADSDLKSVARFAGWYGRVSARTIQRDLSKLVSLKLLNEDAPGTHRLNLKVIG